MNEQDKKIYKKQIENIVEKTGQLLPAFNYSFNVNAVDIFYEFVKENKLEDTFIENSIDDLIKIGSLTEKKYFLKLIERVGVENLTEIYGKEFGSKLQTSCDKGKIKYFDIYQISTMQRSDNIDTQANIMEKILDLYNDDNLMVGIHRTGGWENSGDEINQNGLKLTGHLSSGIDSNDFVNIKNALDKNVSFYNEPGLLISEIARGGNYKNYSNKRYVDISIIAIDKEEFDRGKKQDIIIKRKDKLPILNPKFIRGYITVDNEHKTLEKYVENSKYLDKKNEITPNNNNNLWLQRFKNWEIESSRFPKIKEFLLSKFKKLSLKYKNSNKINSLPENHDIER